jgi:hypothetical protein
MIRMTKLRREIDMQNNLRTLIVWCILLGLETAVAVVQFQ